MSSVSGYRITLTCVLFCIGMSAQDDGPSRASVGHFPGAIQEMIAHAKQTGQATVQAPIVAREYPSIRTLQGALKIATPITGHVFDKETVMSPDGNALLTLYSVRLLDNVENTLLGLPRDKPDLTVLPVEVPTIADDALYVLTVGGSLTIDSVVVNLPERPASLTVGSDYLLFVRVEHNSDGTLTRVATLPIGDAGIFHYDTATDRVAAMGNKDNKQFVSSIMEKSHGIFSAIKTAVLTARQRSDEADNK